MAKYKKMFEVNRKIIDKQLGDGKSYTGYVPEKFCCEEFYHLLENGYVMIDKPGKDGVSEFPMIQLLNWHKDENEEYCSTLRCISHCMFCGYVFNPGRGQEYKLYGHNKLQTR